MYFLLFIFSGREFALPIISQTKTKRAIGSRNRGVLPSSLLSVFIYVCISRSPAPAVTFCSRRRLVVCIVVHVADGASPYQGFRYTPAARMRARCSGHRYQTEGSALAVKSLSVDSVCARARFQALRISAILCVCVCVCVCVWSVPKLVVLISNPAAFAAINQIDGPATILIACVLYHYCSKSATIAIFRPTWSVNHTLVAAPRLERKPTKSRRHHQR